MQASRCIQRVIAAALLRRAAQDLILSPEAFAAPLRAEYGRMGALVRETGMRAE